MFFPLSLEKLLKSDNWKLKVFLLSIFASLFVTYLGNFWYISAYFVDFIHIIKSEPLSSNAWQFHWNSQIWKSTHFFTPITFDPQSHEAKIALRFTIPFLLKIFHQNIWLVYLSQIGLGLFAYLKFIELIFKVSQDRKITFLFAMGISSLYFISSLHLDLLALGDSFAYSFLILGYYYLHQRFLSVSFLLAALLTDERSLIGCVMGIILRYFSENTHAIKYFVSTILALAAYFCLRAFLYLKFGLFTPTAGIGFSIFIENSHHFLLYLFNAFKSYYLIYFFPVIFYKKRIHLVYAIVLLLVILSSLLVWDITRSMSFSFWGLLIGLHFMMNHIRNKDIITGILIAAMLSSMLNITVIFP